MASIATLCEVQESRSASCHSGSESLRPPLNGVTCSVLKESPVDDTHGVHVDVRGHPQYRRHPARRTHRLSRRAKHLTCLTRVVLCVPPRGDESGAGNSGHPVGRVGLVGALISLPRQYFDASIIWFSSFTIRSIANSSAVSASPSSALFPTPKLVL